MAAKLRFVHLVPALAAATAFASAVALAGLAVLDRWLPAGLWHLVFAAGAMPMIFAAMAYFVPVLTRTPEPPLALAALPLAASLAGIAIVAWFAWGTAALRDAAPWAGILASLALLAWTMRRARACLGRPHPGLRWYAGALACLVLGLGAVGLSARLPELAPALRLFHLHMNLLGFIGLTAIGTLQVLLPTVFSRPDPAAATRLAQDLPWSLAGAIAIAAGAAWWWPVAAAGALAYLWPIVRMGRAAIITFGARLWSSAHPASLLFAAVAGLILAIAHGLVHGAGISSGRDALPLFVVAFLVPLVSGAVAQLLPVWLRPGSPTEGHKLQRRPLAAFSRTRAGMFLAGGLFAAFGIEAASLAGIVGALWLLAAMAAATMRALSSPQQRP